MNRGGSFLTAVPIYSTRSECLMPRARFFLCSLLVLLVPSFVSLVQLFLQSDSVCPQGVTQQVTHRVAPLLTGAAYGDNVRLLNSVIQVAPPNYYLMFTRRPSWI